MSEIRKNTLVLRFWAIRSGVLVNNGMTRSERGNQAVGARVERLFKKNQRKALLALFRIGVTQERYAEKRFAPHSLSRFLTARAKANVNQGRETIGLSSLETIHLLANLQRQAGFNG